MFLSATLAAALAAAEPGEIAPAPAAPAPPETAADAQRGVISYPADYFAEARPQTAYDMISRLPGFTFDKGETVRGFAGGAGNVLINGDRPAAKTEALEDTLKRIPASSVQRIDVIRGGAPGIDMQGKPVVANIVQRTDASSQGLFQAHEHYAPDGRHLNGARFEYSRRWNGRRFEALVSGGSGFSDNVGDGARLRITPGGVPLIQGSIYAWGHGSRYNLTGAYETPALGGRLRVNGRVFVNPGTSHEYQELTTPAGGFESFVNKSKNWQREIGARWSRPLGERLSFDGIFIRQGQHSETDQFQDLLVLDQEYHLEKDTEETIGRGELTFQAHPLLSLKGGFEAAFNSLESETRLSRGRIPVPLPAANVVVEEQRSEIFATASWRPMPALSAEAGMRIEESTVSSSGDVVLEKTLRYPKPRLIVVWSPNPQNQVRLRLERYVGQLRFEDFTAASQVGQQVVAGNPDLEPQQEDIFEVAYERRFWSNGSAALTLRHVAISEVVDRVSIRGFEAPGNLGDGTRDEAIVSLTLPLDRLGLSNGLLKGQATRRWSEVIDPPTGLPREISLVRPLEWEAHFTQDFPERRIGWGIDAYSAIRETTYGLNETNTYKLKAWTVVFAEYKPPGWVIRGEIQNPIGRGARRTRTVWAGLRGQSPILYVDDRDVQVKPFFYVVVRKLFGS
ncbi:TonB-dependent receptor plug domain-containing protein [Phenylobacterium terrae]|uniref:TonB-dependent receptor plug domain-containing protein n=1 Tax=Phenylobacterium terrae TaxID=2665495 RepID=A0ABW4N259_9CAUL